MRRKVVKGGENVRLSERKTEGRSRTEKSGLCISLYHSPCAFLCQPLCVTLSVTLSRSLPASHSLSLSAILSLDASLCLSHYRPLSLGVSLCVSICPFPPVSLSPISTANRSSSPAFDMETLVMVGLARRPFAISARAIERRWGEA